MPRNSGHGATAGGKPPDGAGHPDTVGTGVLDTDELGVGGVCGSQMKPSDREHPHSETTALLTVASLDPLSYTRKRLEETSRYLRLVRPVKVPSGMDIRVLLATDSTSSDVSPVNKPSGMVSTWLEENVRLIKFVSPENVPLGMVVSRFESSHSDCRDVSPGIPSGTEVK